MAGSNNGIKTFVAAAALTRGQRVKLDSTADQVDVAGAGENGVGFAERSVDSGAAVAVRLDSPSSVGIAAGAITYGATVYQAASGRLSASASGRKVGLALQAASAAADEFEVMPQVYAS